ncbi:benzyl alcohol O-benzoyltransferase [Trifolium repens]|nr:benzyl alcohol O-benzoyltransferase [Trifolium repens]
MEVSISTAMNQNGSFNFNRNGTFRIDLNLASSVAIMPNFLHSLIESRNPKLHLRSHMNVTEDQTAKICVEEHMWMTNYICTLENDIDSGSFQIHIKFLWYFHVLKKNLWIQSFYKYEDDSRKLVMVFASTNSPWDIDEALSEFPLSSTTFMSSSFEFSEQSFFFGPTEIAAIRSLLPHDLDSKSTTFEVLTSFIWHCHTKVLQPNPNKEVRMMCIVDARDKFDPPIPFGYYGNCFAFPAAVTTAGELCEKLLEFAMELNKKARDEVSEEYMHSAADLMVTKGKPLFTIVRSCLVLDTTYAGLRNLDFGWGKAVYGGMAKPGAGTFPSVHFHVPGQNAKGEEGIFVLISLPTKFMSAFAKELDDLIA